MFRSLSIISFNTVNRLECAMSFPVDETKRLADRLWQRPPETLHLGENIEVTPSVVHTLLGTIEVLNLVEVLRLHWLPDGRLGIDTTEEMKNIRPEDYKFVVLGRITKTAEVATRAKEVQEQRDAKRGPAEKHPWSTTPVTGTFRIPAGPGQPKITSVRVACSVKGRKLGRKFLCHQYPDGTIEVWRQN